jgi:hypothetical protein
MESQIFYIYNLYEEKNGFGFKYKTFKKEPTHPRAQRREQHRFYKSKKK